MVTVKKVQDRKDLGKFIGFPYTLYSGDLNYVPELRIMQKETLNKKKNPFFKHADADYFIALDEKGNVVGRIGAITNQVYVDHWKENYGFFGFFETVNDKEVVKALFDTATGWLKEKGVEGFYGPVNPSTNDTCGTLIEGFDTPPYLMMVHNKEYYDELLQGYGLTKKMDLISYELIEDKLPERMINLSEKIEERLKSQGITFRQIDFNNMKDEAPKLRYIYNKAWENNWGFMPMTEEEFEALAKELRMITSPELVYIAEDKGEPVAFAASLPNVNEIFINFRDGRLFPFNFLKLIRFKKKVRSMRVLTLGIIEKYRKTGIDACLYVKTTKGGAKLGYHKGEASWILETNTAMNRALEMMNGRPYKKYRIYQYNFDNTKR